MKKSLIAISLAILFSLSLAIASISAKPNTVTTMQGQITPNLNSEMTLALGYYVDSLNPTSTVTAYDWDVLGLIFDGFTIPNPFNYFDIEADFPWMLAEKPTWTVVSEQNISYWTFKFRDNIYFFDGKQLTADDVVFTYDFIKWLGEYSEAWLELARILINATKVDDFTVKVFLNTMGYISARYALILVFPKHIYERASAWGFPEEAGIFPNWTLTQSDVLEYRAKSPTDPILTGYGAFKLVRWYPEGAMCTEATLFEFERNEKYFMGAIVDGEVVEPWRPLTKEYVDEKGVDALRGPYIKKLKYRVIIETADVATALIKGEIDMAADFGFGRYHSEFTRANLTLAYAPRLGFGHVLINCRTYPFNKAEFRRAIAYAFDKRAVCQTVWAGYAEPLDSPVPKSMGRWSIEHPEVPAEFRKNVSYFDSNKLKALEELAKLNISFWDDDPYLDYPDGTDVTVEMIGTDTKDVRDIVTTLARSLEACGFKVTTRFVDFRTLLSLRAAGAFQLMFFGYGLGRLPTILEGFASWGTIGRYAGWKNDEFDTLVIESFYQEPNISRIYEKVWRMQQILVWESPDIPIYLNTIVGAYRSAERFGDDGWVGVFEELTGAPVTNTYTLLKAVKPIGYKVGAPPVIRPITISILTAPDAPLWIAAGIVVDIALIAVAFLIRRKPAG
ncbi:MAG: ABC transporter substrate-binding protein [Candidatus Korarchaeota archaeon]|nr:ABC transporter substrate-binding protein [Thermoproteota archaeon]